MHFNVVTSETPKDAMAIPDYYRNLLASISDFTACFVTMNSEMQKELIEHAVYGTRHLPGGCNV